MVSQLSKYFVEAKEYFAKLTAEGYTNLPPVPAWNKRANNTHRNYVFALLGLIVERADQKALAAKQAVEKRRQERVQKAAEESARRYKEAQEAFAEEQRLASLPRIVAPVSVAATEIPVDVVNYSVSDDDLMAMEAEIGNKKRVTVFWTAEFQISQSPSFTRTFAEEINLTDDLETDVANSLERFKEKYTSTALSMQSASIVKISNEPPPARRNAKKAPIKATKYLKIGNFESMYGPSEEFVTEDGNNCAVTYLVKTYSPKITSLTHERCKQIMLGNIDRSPAMIEHGRSLEKIDPPTPFHATPEMINNFCVYYNIPHYAVYGDRTIFHRWIPTKETKSRYAGLYYYVRFEHIFPIEDKAARQIIEKTAQESSAYLAIAEKKEERVRPAYDPATVLVNPTEEEFFKFANNESITYKKMVVYNSEVSCYKTELLEHGIEDKRTANTLYDEITKVHDVVCGLGSSFAPKEHENVISKYEYKDVLVAQDEDFRAVVALTQKLEIPYTGQSMNTLSKELYGIYLKTHNKSAPRIFSTYNDISEGILMRSRTGPLDIKYSNAIFARNCVAFDIKKFYTACLIDNETPFPVYQTLDTLEIPRKQADGHYPLGQYYVPSIIGSTDPILGNEWDWISSQLLNYCIDTGRIKHEEVLKCLRPTFSLPADTFVGYVTWLRDQLGVEAAKGPINTFIGQFGRKVKENTSIVYTNSDVDLSYHYQKATGEISDAYFELNVLKTNSGIPIHKLCSRQKSIIKENACPIRLHILGNATVKLLSLYDDVMRIDANAKLRDLKTDRFIFECSSTDALKAVGEYVAGNDSVRAEPLQFRLIRSAGIRPKKSWAGSFKINIDAGFEMFGAEININDLPAAVAKHVLKPRGVVSVIKATEVNNATIAQKYEENKLELAEKQRLARAEVKAANLKNGETQRKALESYKRDLQKLQQKREALSRLHSSTEKAKKWEIFEKIDDEIAELQRKIEVLTAVNEDIRGVRVCLADCKAEADRLEDEIYNISANPEKFGDFKARCQLIKAVNNKLKELRKQIATEEIISAAEKLVAEEEAAEITALKKLDEEHAVELEELKHDERRDKLAQNNGDIEFIDTNSLLITGCPGTGKSTLIKKIRKNLEEAGKTVRVLAPYNSSAINVNGETIHNALSIGEYGAASQKAMKKMCEADVIIVDEISCCEAALWTRLLALKERSDCPPMILVGDYRQLPPVENTPVGLTRESQKSMEYSQLLKYFCGYKHLKLNKNLRSDSVVWDLFHNLDQAPMEIKHVDFFDLPDINLTYTNERRKAINEQIMAKKVQNAAASRLLAINDAEETFGHGSTEPGRQSVHLYAGLPLISKSTFTINRAEKKVKGKSTPKPVEDAEEAPKRRVFNNEFFSVKSLTGTGAILENESGDLQLFDNEIIKYFRPAYAFTVYAAQGRTINAPYAMHEYGRYSERHAYVAISRTTCAEHLMICD